MSGCGSYNTIARCSRKCKPICKYNHDRRLNTHQTTDIAYILRNITDVHLTYGKYIVTALISLNVLYDVTVNEQTESL